MCELCENAKTGEPGWGRYSRSALRAACEHLGIRRPVRLKCGSCRTPKGYYSADSLREEESNITLGTTRVEAPGIDVTNGDFDFDDFERRYEHVVEVNDLLGKTAANKTLMHELTHCAQRERYPSVADFGAEYDFFDRVYGYRSNPHEVEAQDNVALADRFKVIVG